MMKKEIIEELKRTLTFIEQHYHEELYFKFQSHFELLESVPLNKMLELEEKFQISLPDDFKEFYLNISNGNIFSLYTIEDIYLAAPNRKLNEDFPFESAFMVNHDSLEEELYCKEIYVEEKDAMGSLPITILDGMDTRLLLVIKGKERGNLWLDTCDGILPLQRNNKYRMNFMDWMIYSISEANEIIKRIYKQ
jgi:hypothetical protein